MEKTVRRVEKNAPINSRDFIIKGGLASQFWKARVLDGHFKVSKIFGRSKEFTLSDINSLSYIMDERFVGGGGYTNRLVQLERITLYSETEVLL